VLVEVRKQLDRKISLFSGIDLFVDEAQGLKGFCDFILSYSRNQIFLEAPIVCIVEAKNENIKVAYPQCITEMIGAKQFNEQKANKIRYILGIVIPIRN
jgi:hypothetical protein